MRFVILVFDHSSLKAPPQTACLWDNILFGNFPQSIYISLINHLKRIISPDCIFSCRLLALIGILPSI